MKFTEQKFEKTFTELLVTRKIFLSPWHYENSISREKRNLVYLRITNEQGTIGYWIDYHVDAYLIQFMSCSLQSVSENKRSEVLRYYSLLNNNGSNWSSIHLNIENGITYSKSSILVDDLEDLSLQIIARHFGINYQNLVNFFPGAMKINYGNYSGEEMYNEINNWTNPTLN